MKKYFIIPVITIILISCSHGKMYRLPDNTDVDNRAEITIIRNKNFSGAGIPAKAVLDGWVIARIYTGEYISFHVKPGVHTVGITESIVSIPFEAKMEYYFLVTVAPGGQGLELERIHKAEGEGLIEVSKNSNKHEKRETWQSRRRKTGAGMFITT